MASEFPTVDVDPEPIFVRSSESVWTDTEVRFRWHEPGPIAADSGVLMVGATHSFDETPSPDLLLIPGGMTTFEHARDEKLLAWVRQAHSRAEWTASVCSGSVILAAAGLLGGKRATSHWMAVPTLKAFGVTPVSDERIVEAEGTPEHRIVTCAGVSAGIDLGLWLAGEIAGEGNAPRRSSWPSSTTRSRRSTPGHMSKASAATKAAAAASLSRDLMKPTQLKATTLLLWEQVIRAARKKASAPHWSPAMCASSGAHRRQLHKNRRQVGSAG